MRPLGYRKEVGGRWRLAERNITHIESLIEGLETKEIAIKAIDHERDVLRSHGGVGHKTEGESKATARELAGEDLICEREEGEVSTNVVRAGVVPYLVFESSVVDLEVV